MKNQNTGREEYYAVFDDLSRSVSHPDENRLILYLEMVYGEIEWKSDWGEYGLFK